MKDLIHRKQAEEAKMAKQKGKILVVDDNAGIRSALKILLPLHFAETEAIASPNELISRISDFRPDTVLLDMNFQRDINTGNEGLFWLDEIKRQYSTVQVVLFTAYADVPLAVEGMKRGAFDFIVKPWDNGKLITTLSEACKRHWQLEGLETAGPGMGMQTMPYHSEERMLWGNSPQMLSIRNSVNRIAPTDASVLITGENGTGKDMLAKEIHQLSERKAREMVCVDMGAIPESLFESELFGYVKGAFTDARSDHKGKIEQAQGGTLFLDEIANIPLHLQAKLLRVLQNREIIRVGDTSPVPVDIRLICATNRNLAALVRDGLFREDLYYRINTMHIHLPALRERKDEIIPLAMKFLAEFADRYHRNVSGLGEDAIRSLMSGQWRGNIRELRNCIEKAVILSDSNELSAADIGIGSNDGISGSFAADSTAGPEPGDGYNGDETLEMVEERAIRAAVRRYDGNLSLVAKSLDISRPTLYSKLKKYNI